MSAGAPNCTLPKYLLPHQVSVGQGRARELVLHPALAYHRLIADNERLAKKLFEIESAGLLVPRHVRRMVAPSPELRHMKKKANNRRDARNRYRTDPMYREKMNARQKLGRKLVREHLATTS